MREVDLGRDERKAIEDLIAQITGTDFSSWSLAAYTEHEDTEIYIILSHDLEERLIITRTHNNDDEDSWSIQQLLPP